MGFLAFWLTSSLNVNFLTRLSCVIVYLLGKAQMCALFWSAAFGGRAPEFTCLRLAVVSESTDIEMTRSKNFFWNSDTCTELHFCVEFKSEFDQKNNWVFVEKFLIVVSKGWRKSPISKIFFGRTWIWIPFEILCMLRVSNFKFDLRKGLKFLKQAIISYGLTSLYSQNIVPTSRRIYVENEILSVDRGWFWITISKLRRVQ